MGCQESRGGAKNQRQPKEKGLDQQEDGVEQRHHADDHDAPPIPPKGPVRGPCLPVNYAGGAHAVEAREVGGLLPQAKGPA